MNKRPSPLNLVRGALDADVYYQSGRNPKESRTNIEKLPGAEARTLMMRTLGEMMMFITRGMGVDAKEHGSSFRGS